MHRTEFISCFGLFATSTNACHPSIFAEITDNRAFVAHLPGVVWEIVSGLLFFTPMASMRVFLFVAFDAGKGLVQPFVPTRL